MTIEYREDAESGIIDVTINGRVTEDDYHRIIPQIEAFIQNQPNQKIKILEIIKKYDGFDFSVLSKGFKFDMAHLKNYQKCAVVSDSGWIGPLSRLAGMMVSCDIRTFKTNELEEARNWLKAE